jgi:hypothetical protein
VGFFLFLAFGTRNCFKQTVLRFAVSQQKADKGRALLPVLHAKSEKAAALLIL